MSERRICVVLTTRGNYAKLKSPMRSIAVEPNLALQVVIGGALLHPDYGDYGPIIESDGFSIDGRLDYIAGPDTPQAIAESAGRCTVETSRLLDRLQPDITVVIADRYEALSIAQAALCLNIRIAHLEGGEVSGSIDERIRHAITKLSHIHFPANADAAARIERLGELPESIFVVGTPSLDLLADLDLTDRDRLQRFLPQAGGNAAIELSENYIVVSQNPVATEYDDTARQFAETASAVRQLGLATVWILPNDEAGAKAAAGAVAGLQADSAAPPVLALGSLELEPYALLLKHARCLIGNSSSGIRECAFLGVPAVNIGSRQNDRQRGSNALDVGHDADAISRAARRQMDHGAYPSDPVYGDGRAGVKIARVLADTWPRLDKTIGY